MSIEAEVYCDYHQVNELYRAYMPFVLGGGLFIRTTSNYNLGDVLALRIQLFQDPSPYVIQGKVIWITPTSATWSKPIGVGVQFIGGNCQALKLSIERYLTSMVHCNEMTDTV